MNYRLGLYAQLTSFLERHQHDNNIQPLKPPSPNFQLQAQFFPEKRYGKDQNFAHSHTQSNPRNRESFESTL